MTRIRWRNERGEPRFTPAKLWGRAKSAAEGCYGRMRLSVRARIVRRPIVDGQCDLAVSLTTYGSRLSSVHIAIESIARGFILPGKFVLVVDEGDYAKAIAYPPIRRLIARGLEIRSASADMAGHKKYYALIKDRGWPAGGIVIADDDIIYPRDWFQGIVRGHEAAPQAVVTQWAKVYGFQLDGAFAPYVDWHDSRGSVGEGCLYFMGGSGTLLPAALCEELHAQGDAFLAESRTADDIWLNWVAVNAGFEVRQVRSRPVKLVSVPWTQRQRLGTANVLGGNNDAVFQALYSDSDRRRVFSSRGQERTDD